MEEQVRSYRGREDLAALLAFASRVSSLRKPFASGWHPGDFLWSLQGGYDAPLDNRMWFRDADIEAMANLDGAMLWVEALPSAEVRLADLVLWAEAAHVRAASPGAPALAVRVCDADASRIATLRRLGYRRAAPESVQFAIDLTGPLPEAAPPKGFVVHDCVDVDPAARARVHRDAWSDLGHIGLPMARSQFSAQRYLGLRAAPGYDPRLDLVVADASGALVASCLCWADSASGVGVFEPVGVVRAVRGRRVARLAIHEGLRRLRARGLREAHVGTAHFNTSAIAAYLACGFTPVGRASLWSRTSP